MNRALHHILRFWMFGAGAETISVQRRHLTLCPPNFQVSFSATGYPLNNFLFTFISLGSNLIIFSLFTFGLSLAKNDNVNISRNYKQPLVRFRFVSDNNILKETRNATKSDANFCVFSRRFLKLLF